MSLPRHQSLRQSLIDEAHAMSIGQCMTIDGRDFNEAFPTNWLTGESGVDRFTSSLMGSAYGEFVVTASLENSTITVSRHEGGSERVYEDYDRRKS